MTDRGPHHRAVDAVWRTESPRIIAALSRYTRDVGLAEELAQDALMSALERWPEAGIPDNPGAWLMAAAKRRAIDHFRHNQIAERKHEMLGHEMDARAERSVEALDEALDNPIPDDLLGLIFTACHPVLPREGRVALTLRLLGGLTTGEIARAFLTPESTIAQRIVRAKRTLAEAKVPFEVPRGAELEKRLATVLEVLYLVFNEGYAATAGEDWTRPALCEEALRLGRVLADLAPMEGEVHGLIGLMEIQASRLPARTGPGGRAILLMDQDRGLWDRVFINRGLAALARAENSGKALGPFGLQAAIAACHARASSPGETDWTRIAALYDALSQVASSPIVDLNRAMALSMAFGPAAGLEVVDALVEEGSLAGYHILSSVRGDLLAKLGRWVEARADLEMAAVLAKNAKEKEMLLARAESCARRALWTLPDGRSIGYPEKK